jgi:hypothetical protein
MINFIVYSHIDYKDILNIQLDYLAGLGHITLFINYDEEWINTDEYKKLSSKFHSVNYYLDSDPYATRLLSCFEYINDDYFLFLHDIDIVLNIDFLKIMQFYDFLKFNNYDRVDLKNTFNLNSSLIIDTGDEVSLVKAEHPTDYIYNVNPSIWRKSAFVDMLSAFPDKTYRNIEFSDVQQYCTKFNIFKMHSSSHIQCGWFSCLELFKFLHISHSGKLLPLNASYITPDGQSYLAVKDEYIKILNKYNPRI